MNKSKKAVAVLMLALAVVFAAGCTPDEQTDNGGNNTPVNQGKRLSKVTWVYDEGEYSSQETYTEVHKLTWSGNQLTNLDYYEDGVLGYTVTFSYNNGRLSEFVRYENRSTETFKCVYSGDRLTQIDVTGEDEGTYNFIYDGERNISSIDYDGGYFVFNLKWAAGNVVDEELVSEGNHVYQYDEKKNPYDDTFALWSILEEWEMHYVSANNIVRKQWNSLYGNVSVREYTYTYDGDYPLTCSYSDTGGTGTYYYEYVE